MSWATAKIECDEGSCSSSADCTVGLGIRHPQGWPWAGPSQRLSVALARAGEQIQATGAVVSNVRRGEEASTNNPFPFKGDVAFTLGSRGATEAANQKSNAVMTSAQLQSAIAGQIFKACSDVVTVRFNFSGTAWQTMLFRGANGRVIRGTCVEAVRGSGWPLWGDYRCL